MTLYISLQKTNQKCTVLKQMIKQPHRVHFVGSVTQNIQYRLCPLVVRAGHINDTHFSFLHSKTLSALASTVLVRFCECAAVFQQRSCNAEFSGLDIPGFCFLCHLLDLRFAFLLHAVVWFLCLLWRRM